MSHLHRLFSPIHLEICFFNSKRNTDKTQEIPQPTYLRVQKSYCPQNIIIHHHCHAPWEHTLPLPRSLDAKHFKNSIITSFNDFWEPWIPATGGVLVAGFTGTHVEAAPHTRLAESRHVYSEPFALSPRLISKPTAMISREFKGVSPVNDVGIVLICG